MEKDFSPAIGSRSTSGALDELLPVFLFFFLFFFFLFRFLFFPDPLFLFFLLFWFLFRFLLWFSTRHVYHPAKWTSPRESNKLMWPQFKGNSVLCPCLKPSTDFMPWKGLKWTLIFQKSCIICSKCPLRLKVAAKDWRPLGYIRSLEASYFLDFRS